MLREDLEEEFSVEQVEVGGGEDSEDAGEMEEDDEQEAQEEKAETEAGATSMMREEQLQGEESVCIKAGDGQADDDGVRVDQVEEKDGGAEERSFINTYILDDAAGEGYGGGLESLGVYVAPGARRQEDDVGEDYEWGGDEEEEEAEGEGEKEHEEQEEQEDDGDANQQQQQEEEEALVVVAVADEEPEVETASLQCGTQAAAEEDEDEQVRALSQEYQAARARGLELDQALSSLKHGDGGNRGHRDVTTEVGRSGGRFAPVAGVKFSPAPAGIGQDMGSKVIRGGSRRGGARREGGGTGDAPGGTAGQCLQIAAPTPPPTPAKD